MNRVDAIKEEILRLIADGKVDQVEVYLDRQLDRLSNEEKQELLAWMQPRQ